MSIKHEDASQGAIKRSVGAIIDLTNSDDEDYSFRRPAKQPRPNSRQPSTTPANSQSTAAFSRQPSSQLMNTFPQAIPLDDDDDDELQYLSSNISQDAPRELYGTMVSKAVGVQYYHGLAVRGEMVMLMREPTNQYDSNAIRVVNMMGGQIGHLPRGDARKLARYVDDGSLIIDARLMADKGAYDVPLEINMYGPIEPIRQNQISQRLKTDRIRTNHLDMAIMAAEQRRREELARASQFAATSTQGGMAGYGSSLGNGFGSSQQQSLPYRSLDEIVAQSGRQLNSREIGEYSEKFGMSEEDLKKLPEAIKPKRIKTEMLPYQKQGLAWLLDRENAKLPASPSDDAVQLWKRLPGNKFRNIATSVTVAQEPKLASGGILADDMGLGKTIQIISLIVADMDNIDEDEPRTTLIVAPTSLLSNWSGQISQHVNPKKPLRVFTYHGTGKKACQKPSDFAGYDVVITSYGMVANEYEPKTTKDVEKYERPHGLFSTTFRRIVLDEGHHIRNPKTKTTTSVKSLRARSKWCLSGTPIMNTLTDLGSILSFVGITGGLENINMFNSLITSPVKYRNETAIKLLQAVMAQFTLRRKKNYAFVNLKLPDITHTIIDIEFSKKEREMHEAFNTSAKADFREWMLLRQGDREERALAAQKYKHMFEVILRLRQVCNHWQLCRQRVTDLMKLLAEQKSVELTPENTEALKDMVKLALESSEECPICYDTITLAKQPCITKCGHVFCKGCITTVITGQAKCPMCREPLPNENAIVEVTAADFDKEDKLLEGVKGEDGESDEMDDDMSSKTKALLELLRSKQDEENPKIVLFSQWTSFLSLLEPHLKQAGLRYTRLDGSMNPKKRDMALKLFDEDPSCTILLASLAVASVGLNLVVANTVILCDSWWAPAVEDQAVDRIHRLGQKRECSVFKLVITDSIEQRVLGIQDTKRKLMQAAFNEGEDANHAQRQQHRIRDLQALLG